MALVRLFSCVQAKVLSKAVTPCKAFATMLALVWLLAGVYAKVMCQGGHLCESLVAIAAPKGALSSVCPLVVLEVCKMHCGVVTLRAKIPLPSCW